jgi:hypothetical protein
VNDEQGWCRVEALSGRLAAALEADEDQKLAATRECDAEEHSQDRQEVTPEDRREGQTLPLRQVPEEKPETCNNSRPLVLPELPERE